jgi:hypothetical protein
MKSWKINSNIEKKLSKPRNENGAFDFMIFYC